MLEPVLCHVHSLIENDAAAGRKIRAAQSMHHGYDKSSNTAFNIILDFALYVSAHRPQEGSMLDL
jgi:hypothetical protein